LFENFGKIERQRRKSIIVDSKLTGKAKRLAIGVFRFFLFRGFQTNSKILSYHLLSHNYLAGEIFNSP